ncbi:hypothetical protein C8A00DRAFT_18028 [Chaetomidium leptoderma]|uniref:Nucleotide-diphospho-sugar transferase domain-containing protein n=1 Tax=Chaetomidium leptoderma TaxID=669021 RepID=A0AAN6VHU9_9PEZI|nr:hypothetical protein C8A00DRAFT_18028 [Chaetomidium leptoderma]
MAAFHNLPQAWRRVVFLLPVLVITLILATGLYNGTIPKPPIPKVVFGGDHSTGPFHQQCGTGLPLLDSFPDVIRALWAPLVLPITAPKFTTIDGEEKQLPDKLVHTTPLGKRICIMDIDNRDFTGDGAIFADQLPTADNLEAPAAGFVSHYMYAMIHGYSYKFIRAPKYADRAPHWSKVIFTKELLKEYDLVVMLDYDAMFTTPEVPIEWLLNYWNIGPETLVAMAEDPNGEPNFDSRHRVNINSGFIIAQASEKTQRLFKDWAECPEETRYPGCAVWKDKPFHEQSAFSSFVRYDFLDGYSIDTHPQYIRMLPCKEANGYPEVAGCGCLGQFVRHYWGKKGLTNREFTHNVMAAMTPLLVQSAYKQSGIVVDYRDKMLNGSEVLDKPPSV